MKEKFSFLSNRIAVIGSIGMAVLLVVSLIELAQELVLDRFPLFGLVSLSATVLLFGLWWFGVILPYRRTERMVQRFLEGYMTAPTDAKLAKITPSSQELLVELDKLLHSPQVMDLNKRQAQYLALQNQINPHFLYNTLESIRGEALIAGLDGVANMTEALAKFFRYTITKVENLVSVEEELDNCETYFRIQKYRFGDRLRLHIDCDPEEWEEIRNCQLPKLTLQPILENSIIHGTELKIGVGNLRIAFSKSENRLKIVLSDDGVGMDEATLARLNDRLGKHRKRLSEDGEKKKGGIALANVNSRIHLLFGDEYGLHVYSLPENGTDVEITLPIRTKLSAKEASHGA